MLAKVEGGFGGWRYAFWFLLGGLAPSPTLDQLNGKWPIRHPSKPCSPYGIGELQTHVMVFKKLTMKAKYGNQIVDVWK